MTVILLFTIFVNFLFTTVKIGLPTFRFLKTKIKCCVKITTKERQRRRLKYLNDRHKNAVKNSASAMTAVDLTKFEQDSINDQSQPAFIEGKTKIYTNLKSYRVFDNQKKFHDMFEMKT